MRRHDGHDVHDGLRLRVRRARRGVFLSWPHLSLALALLAAPAALARVELRFTEGRDLPQVGLQLRTLPSAREKPLPALTIHPYRVESGTNSYRVELYAPRDLWVAEQHAVEWEDLKGNRLTLAVVRRPLPGPFARPHVSREEYEAAAAPARGASDWSQGELAAWVRDYMGVAVTAHADPAPPARLAELVEMRIAGPATNTFAYVFRMNPQGLGARKAPADLFFVSFHLGPDTDPAASLQAIRLRFWQYLQPSGAPAGPTPASATGAAPAAVSPELAASRRQVADSIRNLKDWWSLESEHYIILSSMKAGQKSAVKELQGNVEKVRVVFEDLIPAQVPITAVSVIRIPSTDGEYTEYVGDALAWSAGMWMPNRKELVLRSFEDAGTKERRELLFRTAYHEAFHQYLFYALDRAEASAWFNEGHAALFETVEIRSRGARILQDDAKVAYLQQLLKERELTVAEILGLSYDDFYAPTQAQRVNHYVMAWGFVYYLRLGATKDAREGYAGILDGYLDALRETRDAAEATRRAFAGIDLDQLQRDFRAFWTSASRRSTAERIRL